ncbi:MAG: glycosyltransferase family 9 protein [candidate division Zixibacteria bacterium]|nr:glycosyltransferase family 9 protein [candidate division Zixibacteria bacterium]
MRKLKITGKERFLVIRTDRIGDVLLSTPVLEAIKSRFPESHLTMMVSPYAADVVENNPNLDDVIIDDHKDRHKGIKGFFMLVKEVKERGFDVGILLRPTLKLALLLFLGGIKYRIGTGYRFYQIFFNQKVYVHRKINLRHEADYNFDLLKPLGIAPQKIFPRVYLHPEEETFAHQIWEEFKITPEDTVVVIHPGSGNSSLNLPAKRFAQVADGLVKKVNAKIIFTGMEREKGVVDFIKNDMEHTAIDLTGRTSLRELAAVLKNCDVVVSNSTGPMHLAVALDTPTVAIFCPIFAAGPIRWGPYGERHQVILPPVPVCFKCKPKSCPHYDCMEKIKTEQIVSKVCAVLKEKNNVSKIKTPKIT